MKRTIQASVVIMLSVLFTSFAYATESETFTLATNTDAFWTFNLHEGSRVTGSISIQGGTQNDLAVWVTDPVGANVLNLGVVRQECSIDFVANQSGAHRLYFNNGGGALADGEKIVSVSYNIENPSRLVMVAGVVLAIVAGVLVIIGYYVRRKKTARLTPDLQQTPPSQPS